MNKPVSCRHRFETHRLDLTHHPRPRRNRKAEWARRLVAEHVLTADDLIWPLFLIDGEKRRDPVAAMPGVDRLSVDEAVREAERAVDARHSGDRVLSLHRGCAATTSAAAKPSTQRISSAAPAGRSSASFRSSASSPTSRSTPTRATATTGSSARALRASSSFSTTRRSRCSRARRSIRRAPAPTSSRPPT